MSNGTGDAMSLDEIDRAAFRSALGEWDIADEWDENGEFKPLSPRAWLLGNVFCRGFVSSLLGGGGVGKTALRYAQYLSCATGRSLTGEHVFVRARSLTGEHVFARVLIISLEDGVKELRRRIRAAMLHHEITRAEVAGWVFLAAPSRKAGKLKLMVMDERGRAKEGDLAAILKQVIVARKIDLVALDPFIKTHSVSENSNVDIDEVMNVLTDMASELDIAVDTPHHMSKGPTDPGNADKGRGASSQKDAGRLVFTLAPMTVAESQIFGLSEQERRSLIRLDSGKVNICPATEARWFRLVNVRLGNATELYPNGDEVQTVEPWTPPSIWADLSNIVINDILDDIEVGINGSLYSDHHSAADDRAAWRVVTRHAPDINERAAKEIIKSWVRNGVLVRTEAQNPETRKTVKGLRVNDAKRPS